MTRGQWQGKSYYDPNPVQRIIRQQYDEGITAAAKARKGARLVVCMVGDAIDGNHHDTKEIVTNSVEEQARMHEACMDESLKTLRFSRRGGDKLYYIEGTEAHTGQKEDDIARNLSAEPYHPPTAANEYRDGVFVWPRLLLNINGIRFDIAHHGGKVGRLAWGRENSLRSTLKSIYFDCLEHERPIPHYWIRADRHFHIADKYSGERGSITGIVLPALQLRTRFAHKVGGDIAMSTIGTVYVVVEPDGSHSWHINKLTCDEQEASEVAL
jgi:hypothetical protein